MTNRVIDLADRPARLTASGGLLNLHFDNGDFRTIPFTHVAAIICSHGQVSFTQAVLAELAAANGLFIACDAKHQPVSMSLPLVAHHEQTVRFGLQSGASLSLRKRVWRGIVAAKIRAQASVLSAVRGHNGGLSHVAERVKVGDIDNREAFASRLYWQSLFGDPAYRRSGEDDDRNALLNYGYAIIRAATARALCGAGLHPGIPLHHHNKYDPYPLADDLMEPFRPLVDLWVVSWVSAKPGPWPLDRESKATVLTRLTGRFSDGCENRSLFDWLELTAENLVRCLEGRQPELKIPAIRHVTVEQEMA